MRPAWARQGDSAWARQGDSVFNFKLGEVIFQSPLGETGWLFKERAQRTEFESCQEEMGLATPGEVPPTSLAQLFPRSPHSLQLLVQDHDFSSFTNKSPTPP